MTRNPYDGAWRKLRKQHLAQHPTCVRCGRPGMDVDHIVSVRQAPRRRLDPTNLQTLCHGCHSRLTRAYDGQLGPRGAGVSGYPLAPSHPWHKAAMDAGQITTQDQERWKKARRPTHV